MCVLHDEVGTAGQEGTHRINDIGRVHMKRITIIAVAAALLASTAAIAFSDDADTGADIASSETRALNEAQARKALLLANYFADYLAGGPEAGDTVEPDAAVDEITTLRTGDTVIGWGAMFKLLQLAEADNVLLSELLTDIEGDEGGWAFGRRFKELELDKKDKDTPKNLGQLKKQDREPKGNQGKKP